MICLSGQKEKKISIKMSERVKKGRKEVELSVEEPVFYKINLGEVKLDQRWTPL